METPAARQDSRFFSLSNFPDQEIAGNRFMKKFHASGNFKSAIEFRNHLALVENLSIRNGMFFINGKILLNAQHGQRLIRRVLKAKGQRGAQFSEDIVGRFGETSKDARMDRRLPAASGGYEGLDLVLDCRQSHNYYHFMTEVMCHLALAVEAKVSGNIYIHSPSETRSGFIDKFISDFFPELVGRVIFPDKGKAEYRRALVVFGMQQQYFMCGEGMVPSLRDFAPDNWRWRGRRAERQAYGLLVQNSFEENLRKFRETVLSRVRETHTADTPKRIFVVRNPRKTKRRPMVNGDLLAASLEEIGFVTISFEDMSPTEQVAHMADAEIVVMAHGAGMTNMMFAASDAVVVELSNLQTARIRFGDFNQHAHAAGCRYLSILCDHAVDAPEVMPSLSSDGHVGVFVPENKVQTLCNMVAALGQS